MALFGPPSSGRGTAVYVACSMLEATVTELRCRPNFTVAAFRDVIKHVLQAAGMGE